MIGNKRQTLGLQIINIYGEYPTQLWPGFQAAAEERNANVIIFPGRTANFPTNYGFEYQSSTIYDFINPTNIDALVIVSGTFASFLSAAELERLVKRDYGIPTVSLSIVFPDLHSVGIDNKTGLQAVILHLIRCHNCKNLAFIGGPQSNPEAAERYQVFLDTLKSEGLVFDTQAYFEGSFLEPSGSEAVRAFFIHRKLKPDAIICANDNMAIGAIRALHAMGIPTPARVKVTGFDNIEGASMIHPPLTTVSQPLAEQARVAALTALDLATAVHTGLVPPLLQTLPTHVLLRSSCGCLPQDVLVSGGSPEDCKVDQQSSSPLTASDIARELIKLAESQGLIPGNGFREQKILEAALGIFLPLYRGKAAEEKNLERFENNLSSDVLHGLSVEHWSTLTNFISLNLEKFVPDRDIRNCIERYLEKTRGILTNLLKSSLNADRLLLTKRLTAIRDFISSLSGTINIHELVDQVHQNLHRIGIKSCFIFTYEKPIENLRGGNWQTPAKSRVLLGFQGANQHFLEQKLLSKGAQLPRKLSHGPKRISRVITSLYFREEQLGYMVMEVSETAREIYDLIASHISTVIKTAMLFQAREESEERLYIALDELQSFNRQLKSISEKDELTGLYNRRGFLNIAHQSLGLIVKMHKPGMVFYADLDGLKQINDLYGHESGDTAIKAAAEMLVKTFRTMDVIARLGGDEFTIFTADTPQAFTAIVARRLEQHIAEYNARSHHHWQLSISVGWETIVPGENRKLPDIMKAADTMLYEIKRARKQLTPHLDR